MSPQLICWQNRLLPYNIGPLSRIMNSTKEQCRDKGHWITGDTTDLYYSLIFDPLRQPLLAAKINCRRILFITYYERSSLVQIYWRTCERENHPYVHQSFCCAQINNFVIECHKDNPAKYQLFVAKIKLVE